MEPSARLVLLRLSGEVSIKAPATRRRFVVQLARNLRDALASEGAGGEGRPARHPLYALLPAGPRSEPGLEALTRVFGLQSVSPAERRPLTALADVVRAGEELFRESVRGRRFAVRARRVGGRERIALRPSDVERELGAALLPISAGVDLTRPEFTARLELFERETCFFSERLPAPGGLPLGVEGRAVALLSGGFDSAVAAWQLLRRGVSLDYVFCNLGGRSHLHGVLRVAKLLADQWSYGERPRLHALDFEGLAAELRGHVERRYWQVVLKRLMLRAAELVADARGAAALATGDAVGQVSSQTLQNLAVISRAAERPILRPLVGSNKDEILALARRIGSFELSKVVGEYCAMVPSRPATAAKLEDVLAEEAHLDPARLRACVAERRVFDLRGLGPEELALPGLDLERIPEGAIAIDLRSRAEFESWHAPGALHLEFAQALRAWPSFDRAQRYVLYCEIGLKSAHLAERMREQGFEAHHIGGGLRALRRLYS
jgi:thiamine biosynthesis protein ThiI